MEIYIGVGNDRIRLPVLPESFELTVDNLNSVVNVNAIGDINLIGKTGLKEISFSSFFPVQDYYFNEYSNPMKPFQFISKLEGWRTSGKPVRVIITKTHINLEMAIESFSYGERDGTKDVYYTIELKEYKRLKTKTVAKVKVPVPKRPVKPKKKKKRKTYVVKRGDNLWNIAKKYYGNGSQWKKIYNQNKKVIGSNPNLIYPGQKYVIP